MKTLIPALISATLLSCGGGGGGSTSDGFPMQGPCGNGLANGNEIISGPTAPAGAPYDYDQPFRSLTVDPTDPSIVYVGTESNGILKTTDGGTTWTRLRKGLRHYDNAYPEIYDISVSTTNHNVLYAVANQGPGPLVSDTFEVIGGVYRSDDAGENWYRINCGLDGIHVSSIQVSPDDEDNVVSGVPGRLRLLVNQDFMKAACTGVPMEVITGHAQACRRLRIRSRFSIYMH